MVTMSFKYASEGFTSVSDAAVFPVGFGSWFLGPYSGWLGPSQAANQTAAQQKTIQPIHFSLFFMV
jgi:hypothetical protein